MTNSAKPVLADALADCFNATLGLRYGVRCVGGFNEPEYLPGLAQCATLTATPRKLAQLRYTQDYAASALHEIAHWCIAGDRRRQLVDFGYAYQPPPRDPVLQERFFVSELSVQALEALFAMATGVHFAPSADNFDCSPGALAAFASAVNARLCWLCNVQRHQMEGLGSLAQNRAPNRARQYLDALRAAGLMAPRFQLPTMQGPHTGLAASG